MASTESPRHEGSGIGSNKQPSMPAVSEHFVNDASTAAPTAPTSSASSAEQSTGEIAVMFATSHDAMSFCAFAMPFWAALSRFF